jgi:hypothetical protein
MRHHAVPDSAKPGAPIAQVLNDMQSAEHVVESSSTIQIPQAAPFSGKLADLLLDTQEQLLPSERRWAEHQHEEHSRENPVIKLPQLPQLPAKTTERARIPPLLQGLHQPPPLPPTGRLFPPITDGASGFEQDIRDRIHSANASHEARSKRDQESAPTRSSEPNNINETHVETDRDEQDDIPPSNSVHISDQETTSHVADEEHTPPVAAQNQRSRKRKKWSDEETRDLLFGVSRFGIGKWKRILNCSDYKFAGRTAVDLKDRFRVCCPGEGLKLKRPKQQQRSENQPSTAEDESNISTTTRIEENTNNEVPVSKKRSPEETGNGPRRSHPKLVELGIQTPFVQSTRRPRQGFSSQDDENLLKGFEKYGAFWHSMRDDKDLGFGSRHATDLRDRFRIRYPEAFARAGYKVKPKVKGRPGNKPDATEPSTVPTPRQDPHKTPSRPGKERLIEDIPSEVNDNDNEVTERSMSKPSGPRPSLAYTPYFPDPSDSIFLADSNATADKDGPFSPIILNRNILQWADANTFLMTSPSSNSYNTAANHDMSMHITYPNDGLHINPMATLKLPLMALSGHNHHQPQYLQHHHSHQNILANNNNNSTTSYPANATSRTVSSSYLDAPPSISYPTSSSKANTDHHLLRTPNLPTIVFPHVPAASARGMVHNLPTPADLLSGMDLDNGGDGQGEEGGGGPSGYAEQR